MTAKRLRKGTPRPRSAGAFRFDVPPKAASETNQKAPAAPQMDQQSNDKFYDPASLPKYLLPADDVPTPPTSTRGRTLEKMMTADEDTFWKIPHLEAREDKRWSVPRLKLGTDDEGREIHLYIRNVAQQEEGGGGSRFRPKVTAGTKTGSNDRKYENSWKLDETTKLGIPMLEFTYWTEGGAYKELGLNESAAMYCWKNWLVRLWRAFFPSALIPRGGRRTKNGGGPTEMPGAKAGKKRKAQEDASILDAQTGMGTRYDDHLNGEASTDEDEFEEHRRETEAFERLGRTYGYKTNKQFFDAWNTGKQDFDLDDHDVVERIRQGFEVDDNGHSIGPGPPVEVLRKAQKEFENGMSDCETTFAFSRWYASQQSGVTESRTRIVHRPSLQEVAARQEGKKRMEAEAEREKDKEALRIVMRRGRQLLREEQRL